MTRKDPFRLREEGSIDEQIRRVEQRLIGHHLSSKAHLTQFRSKLRERMTSPLVLILASGVGFVLAASTGRQSTQSTSEGSRRSDEVPLLTTLVTMVSLTGSMLSLWQRFGATARPTRSASSAVKPEAQKNTPG